MGEIRSAVERGTAQTAGRGPRVRAKCSKGCGVPKTAGLLDEERPSAKEWVAPHRPRDPAPKMSGAQARRRNRGSETAHGRAKQHAICLLAR